MANNFSDTPQTVESVTQTIRNGAINRTCVAIRYQDKSGDITERTVEPYEFKDGKLYAFCRERQGIRGFLTLNILAAVDTDDTYEPKFPVLIA